MAALKEDRLAIDALEGGREIPLMDRVDEEAVLVGVLWMCTCVESHVDGVVLILTGTDITDGIGTATRFCWILKSMVRRARRRRSSRGSHPRLLTILSDRGLTFVSVMNKTCSPSLNRFQLILVLLVIWIPDSATIFGYWSN